MLRSRLHAGAWALVLCAVLAASSGGARADVGEGNGEIGFDLGGTDFDSNTSDESATRFSLRGGYHFTELFQLEGQLTSDTSTGTFGFPIDVAMQTLFVNGVFNFHPNDKVTPYVLIGAGRVTLDLDFDFPSGLRIDDNSTAFQVAGGVRLFFGKTKRTAVRIELASMQEDTFDESSSHRSLTVGFTWRLGER